ncbi:MAG: Mut7-C RNAse domain-containing protein [Armatimonadota bacterium]
MRFFADCNVGKLARWLRMLGFDVLYCPDIEDDVLVCRAMRENRIILTRDTEIAFRKAAQRSLFILSDETPEQVRQVITELGLKVDPLRLTPRCALCNEVLEEVPKETVRDKVPPYTYSTHDKFRRCGTCGKVYWHGSHVERVLREAAGLNSCGNGSSEDGSSRRG